MPVAGFDAGAGQLFLGRDPDFGDQQHLTVGQHPAHRVAGVFVAHGVIGDGAAAHRNRPGGAHVEHQEFLGLPEMLIDPATVLAGDGDPQAGFEAGFKGGRGVIHGVLSRLGRRVAGQATAVPRRFGRQWVVPRPKGG